MRSLPAFVACFGILMAFWSAHYRYFRRYGIEDGFTLVTTLGVLVLVLFSVYPLKFLFTLLFENLFHFTSEESGHALGRKEAQMLYGLYGGGFAGIWLLYALMYQHALKLRHVLGLKETEVIKTRASLYEYLTSAGMALTSVVLALATTSDSAPGLVYIALGPLQVLNIKWHSRKIRRAHAHS